MRRSICLYLIATCLVALPANAGPKWSMPQGVKSIEVNGYDMAYQETGSGTPIVLVLGALNDYRVWPEIAAGRARSPVRETANPYYLLLVPALSRDRSKL
jgi:hypothetical protein